MCLCYDDINHMHYYNVDIPLQCSVYSTQKNHIQYTGLHSTKHNTQSLADLLHVEVTDLPIMP